MTEYVDTSIDTSIIPQETTVNMPGGDTSVKPEEKSAVKDRTPDETSGAEDNDNAPWPKKAANAVSRLKAEKARMAGEYKEKLEAANAELERYRSQSQPQKPAVQVTPTGVPKTLENGEPNILAYTSVVEYQRDLAKFDAQQLWKEQRQTDESKQKETQQTQEAQRWVQDRVSVVQEQEAKFAEENPRAVELFEEYKDVVQAYPPHITQAILECENAPLAMFNLAEAGKIEELGRVTYAQATRMLAKAELTPISKPQTQAPKPLTTSRGAVAGEKDPSQMTDEEFNAWRRASIAKKR